MENRVEELCATRLRELRRSRGLTLDQCESLSGGAIKAVVLGSYERGNRAISLARLEQLARFFEVPLEYFLTSTAKGRDEQGGWSFDLRTLRNLDSQSIEIIAVKKFLNSLAALRDDWAGEYMTIRKDDARTIEIMLSRETESFFERLTSQKILLIRKKLARDAIFDGGDFS